MAGTVGSFAEGSLNPAPAAEDAVPTVSSNNGNGTFCLDVDEVLLARVRRREIAAQQQLYGLFAKPVFTLARRLCRTFEDAEDVMQETFLEVFRSLPMFRGQGSFAGWVRRITVTKALQRLRQDRRAASETELDEELERGSETGPMEPILARMDLAAALKQLPDTARVIVWLHEVEGWTHDEVAALWGRSASFSKSQLARACARLRASLGTGGRAE